MPEKKTDIISEPNVIPDGGTAKPDRVIESPALKKQTRKRNRGPSKQERLMVKYYLEDPDRVMASAFKKAFASKLSSYKDSVSVCNAASQLFGQDRVKKYLLTQSGKFIGAKKDEVIGRPALSDRERLAAHYYLADPERRKQHAVMRAFCPNGIEEHSTTDKAIVKRAKILFRRPAFAKYLYEEMERLNRKLIISEEAVLQEWATIGLLDPGDAYDAEGNLLPVNKMPLHVRKCIASVDVDEHSGTKRIKFHSKAAALDSIGKHFGLFKQIKEVRLRWMDDASVAEKLERRRYIELELQKRGLLPPPMDEHDENIIDGVILSPDRHDDEYDDDEYDDDD